jgi:hypothetical protein
MVRRWYVPLATLALMAGTAMAAGAASAAPALAQSTPAVVSPGHTMIGAGSTVTQNAAVNGVFSPAAQSTNWSGYAVHSAKYRSVSATWVVPKPKCAAGSKKYAAFWVGLDGYKSNSVEQTGTDSDCKGKNPKYYGWYEMFPAAPVFFTSKVKPGNVISASVTFSGTNTYKLVLQNKSRGWTKVITKKESGLARTSAEVITEAPSSTNGVLPLADFVKITYSSARVNGKLLKNLGASRIVMINSSGKNKDTTSAVSGSDTFNNVWYRSS